jgi:hypothetical protein
MTDENVEETPKELAVTIVISNQEIKYKSDFNEPETVFWIEAVKDLIIKNAFSRGNLQQSE